MSAHQNLIRWAGGKKWFIPIFTKLVKGLKFADYYEPFLGGGSIFFNMETVHRAFLSDLNKNLIIMYQAVKDNPEAVISKMKEFPIGKEGYYLVRSQEPVDDIAIAARFIYLNHYSFNGIYRENAAGKYNVPFGFVRTEYDYSRITEASKKLESASICFQDFEAIASYIKENDLVFLDPPYSRSETVIGNSFVSYNAQFFRLKDQERLRHLIDTINKKHAYYIMTNGNDSRIAEIFDGCGKKLLYSRKCVISSIVSARGSFEELIYTNIPIDNMGELCELE